MEQRTLDITVISAKDLNDVNLVSKMDVYAVVSISGDSKFKQKTKTGVDRAGGTHPTWDFPLKFTINESLAQQNHLTLVFELRCQRSLGDKEIGKVTIPIKQLLESTNGDDKSMKFVSYQVRKPSGKAKGELNLSYRFGDKVVGESLVNNFKVDEPVTAYPAVGSSVPPQNVDYYEPPAGGYDAYPPPVPGYDAYPPRPQPTPGPSTPGYGYPPPPPPGHGYPPPPHPGHGYPPPPPPGHGYPPPPPPGHGYPPPPPPGHGYPPPPPPGHGYPSPPPSGHGYPPPPSSGHGYPPPPSSGHGYPPPPAGYGNPAPPAGYGNPAPPGYGYPPASVVQQSQKKNKFGMGLGAGLVGGMVGGLLVGDMVSDAAEYDGGFEF